jgi:hypothetical protein
MFAAERAFATVIFLTLEAGASTIIPVAALRPTLRATLGAECLAVDGAAEAIFYSCPFITILARNS